MNKLPKINPNQNIAVDLETLDPELKVTAPGFISKVGYVVGIAVATEDMSCYVPIRHAKGHNYDEKEVIEWLNYTLSGDTEKIFHNAQYDVGWLNYMGVQLNGRIFDTSLAAPLLNENRFAYTLDSLGKIYCGEGKFEEALSMAVANEFNQKRTQKKIIRLKENVSCNKYAPFVEAKQRISQFYDLWPREVQERYDVLGNVVSKTGQENYLVPTKRNEDIKALLWACDPDEMGTYPIQDVELTYKLYKIFKEQLKEENLTSLMKMENELIMPLLEMRMAGVRLDMDEAVKLDIKYTQELDRLQNKLNDLCGFNVDVNIDNDLIAICEKFNLEYKKTLKGNPCFSSEMIPKDSMGIFETVLDIRTYLKARDTYIRGYIFGCSIDGWLHGQYNQLKSDAGGTVTGRLSSSNPNMQNLPNPKTSVIGKEIRGLFLPDNEDEKWLSMDYSGQEPKMLVHIVLAMDDKIRELAADKDRKEYFQGAALARLPEFRGREADFHTAVAAICQRKEYELMHKSTDTEEFKKDVKAFRPKAKSIGLGVMYGSGNAKVAEEMTKKGFPMSTEEAADIRSSIYAGVPFLEPINKKMMALARDRGYIKTILGRRGHFDLWECPVFDRKDKEKLDGKNFGFKTKEEAYLWYNKNRDEYNIGRPARAMTYKALNKYIQGSSADQTKTAMLHLYKRGNLNLNVLDIFYRRIKDFVPPKFKTQVHDEINVSLTKNEDYKWYQYIMENCIPLKVEAVADPVVCTKWSEAK